MIYYIDVDNTITRTRNGEYEKATPIKSRIRKINKLFDEGNIIVMCTARGAVSGINWLPMTEKQLVEWGVKYTHLEQKPYYDVLVDDHAMSDKQFFNVN